jgi:PAS domain S-box-containing protein
LIKNGNELFNSGKISIQDFKTLPIELNSGAAFDQKLSLASGDIFYTLTRIVNIQDNTFKIVLAVRDIEIMSSIGSNAKILPFLLVDKRLNAKGETIKINGNEFTVKSLNDTGTVKSILNANSGNISLGTPLGIDGSYYIIVSATAEHFNAINNSFNAFYAIDITSIQQAYKNHLVRVLLFIGFFFIIVLLIIRLFHNRIISTMLSIEKKLEIKLNARTREIIDNNEQLNQIFHSTSNGIRLIDKNYNIINVNSAFTILSGIKPESVKGNKCYDHFPSTNCHTTNCPLDLIKQGLSIVQSREIRFNQLGKKIVCQYKAMPFLSKEGDLIGIIEDFKDITDLHSAQEAVAQTQKQFESLLDSMPLAIFIRDFEGNMYYQNSYMSNLFGSLEFGNKNLKSIYPSQINRFFEEDKLVEKYGIFVGEEKLTDKYGVERTYVTHKFKFIGINNKTLIGGVSIDITKRKKAEHNSYVLTKAIVNTPIGVLITSPEGKVEFCNPEFQKYSGSSTEEIIGTTFHLFEPSQANKLQEPIDIAQKGGVYQGELHLKLYNSLQQWFSLSIAPVFNREGMVAHLIFVFDNITDRKDYEKQIVVAKSQAEESNRLKSAFLSNLSHEIRTPLNAILGFSSLLNNSTVSQEEKFEIPNLLVSHSNELLELINDLIDISAIETNQFTVNKTECKLNQLITETFNEVTSKSHVKEKRIKTAVRLGVSEDGFTILSDPKRLTQVISHLLSNAIKFTSSGFVEFGYTFKDGNNLLFYVIDSGVGLSEEEKSIIFNPFRQADDSRTRNFNGLGLGLAISKHIIERLGGKIWVNSVKNQGSTFYFTLPYIPIKTKFDPVVLLPKHKDSFNWQTKTILVADDIDSNYKFIQTLLKPTGANLMWAKNGKEAVDMVKNNKVDIVLMDIVMPVIDGFEATRLIKKIDSNIKIICQTAYPTNEHHIASQQSGMDSYLAKPIAPIAILTTIDEFIAQN